MNFSMLWDQFSAEKRCFSTRKIGLDGIKGNKFFVIK